jgi:hypothetical protein
MLRLRRRRPASVLLPSAALGEIDVQQTSDKVVG